MQINNITVPDAGTTTQYITDPIGGWVYEVTTTTTVVMHNLADAQAKLAAAQQARDDAEALIAQLSPEVATLITLTPTPISVDTQNATSTPLQ